MGHSLGGAVVAAVARSTPEKVASLTLLAPVGYTADADAEYLRGFAAAATRRELKPLVGRLFADPSLVTRQLVDDLLRYKRLDGVDKALSALLGTLLDGDRQAIDTPALLEGVDVPVTVMWGTADGILPPPEGTGERVDGRAHAAHGGGERRRPGAAGARGRMTLRLTDGTLVGRTFRRECRSSRSAARRQAGVGEVGLDGGERVARHRHGVPGEPVVEGLRVGLDDVGDHRRASRRDRPSQPQQHALVGRRLGQGTGERHQGVAEQQRVDRGEQRGEQPGHAGMALGEGSFGVEVTDVLADRHRAVGGAATIAAERSVNPSPGSVSGIEHRVDRGAGVVEGDDQHVLLRRRRVLSRAVRVLLRSPRHGGAPGAAAPGRGGAGWSLATLVPARATLRRAQWIRSLTGSGHDAGEQRWEVVQAGPFRYCS